VVLAVKGSVDKLPVVATEPLHPPLALHDSAFVEDQMRVVELPKLTWAEADVKETTGAGGVLTFIVSD